MTTTRLSLTKTVLATIAVAGLMTGAAACGGSDSSSTDIDKQALVELLLAAAQSGDSEELAAIVAQADPDLVAEALPEVRDELGSPLPPIVPAGEDDSPGVTVDDSTLDPAADPQTDQPSDPQESPSDPSSPPTSSVVSLPGGVSLPTPSLPRVSLPTSSVVSLPGGVSLPTPTPPQLILPTSEVTFDLVQADYSRSQGWLVQAIVTTANGSAAPSRIIVNFTYSVLGSTRESNAEMELVQQADRDTSIWSKLITRDGVDPCSLSFDVYGLASAPSMIYFKPAENHSC
ncbi:MAG: hypothetical protein ACO2Y7_08000 [Ilumatobacteraceae bacterium]